jgi:8-oxo-dGTP pyrophosphatase MutT (NUDIX family)
MPRSEPDAEPYPLRPAHSVGAIIVTPDNRFLLQRRDHVPHIWYPGAWGLFGGGIDPGESELDALRRELQEEIGFALREARLFTRFQFDCAFVGDGMIDRTFFELPIEADAVVGLRLTEGREMGLIEADRVIGLPDMIGHDGFALYLYLQRHRITRP